MNWSRKPRELGRLPVVNFAAGGIATPADAALMMQLGVDGVFVGSGIFKSGDPARRAKAIVEAVDALPRSGNHRRGQPEPGRADGRDRCYDDAHRAAHRRARVVNERHQAHPSPEGCALSTSHLPTTEG